MGFTVRSEIAHAPVTPVVGAVVARRALFQRLDTAGRVTEVSAPAGSGKTVLLRSWIREAGLAGRAAWVPVQGGERDPQRFWIAVADALRATAGASALVRPLTAAPDQDGWAIVERLLKDLARLDEPVRLVIDDVHELASTEALAQLELLVTRAPPELRFVLATRQDLRLGLHRLRLEGQLTEIRTADLRFTLTEARTLFESAGVQLPDAVLTSLYARAEGWAAGLRLAALSLAGHPDPVRFAEEFSGSERTVAEYLLAEVLEQQGEEVRRLLLRTSVLERVNGELADLLTGGSGGERVLQDLEQVGAFADSLDAQRSWFRYHRLFADLLQLELRRTAPSELTALHGAAASWFAGHGYPVEAIRHGQAAEDWDLAARLLADHWLGLILNGQGATVHALLTRFPADAVAANTELTALMAADELTWGSPERAGHYLAQAARRSDGSEGSVPVPAERRRRMKVLLAMVRLWLARQRGDLPAAVEETDRLLAAVEAPDAAPLGLGEDLRALAVISLGIAETWAGRLEDAGRHLEQGVALARRVRRPYLELTSLAHGAVPANYRSYALGGQWSRQAIELAHQHGWGEDQAVGVAYAVLGNAAVVQGLPQAAPLLERAGQTLRTEIEPAAGVNLQLSRGVLDLARGRNQEALSALQTAERLAGTLVTLHTCAPSMRSLTLLAFLRLGQSEHAEAVLAGLDSRERGGVEMRTVMAYLLLGRDDPQAATTALAPVLDGSVSRVGVHTSWMVGAVLLEAIARDALGDPVAAGRALEHALDLAEPDSLLIPFQFYRAPELLKRHARYPTAHTALIADILGLLAETSAPEAASPAAPPGQPRSLRQPLSQAETRVLRYLPTSLTVTEIAGQLYLSANTVRTHMRHVYDKLDVHRRHEVVERARALGLLAPSSRLAAGEYQPQSQASPHASSRARI